MISVKTLEQHNLIDRARSPHQIKEPTKTFYFSFSFQKRSDFIFQTIPMMTALSHLHSNSEIVEEVWDPVCRVFGLLPISLGFFFLCIRVKSHRIPEARSSEG